MLNRKHYEVIARFIGTLRFNSEPCGPEFNDTVYTFMAFLEDDNDLFDADKFIAEMNKTVDRLKTLDEFHAILDKVPPVKICFDDEDCDGKKID